MTKSVPWVVFVWAMGILLAILGLLFNAQVALSNKVNGSQAGIIDIKTQLAQIQTDIKWLRENISRK